MKEKLKQVNKVTISTIILIATIVTAVIIGTVTYSANNEEYGNSDIGSGKLYFISNNKEITSTPINETVALHVNIGLAAGAVANKDYLIKINNPNFVINGLEEDNSSITFDSNGNLIVCTVHYNSDGTYNVVVSGWQDGTSLDFDLIGEMKEKGEVVATMETSQDVYGGQLTATLIAYGDNEISYTNSKSVNYNKLSISSDGTEIKDESGNSLVTNGGVLEYILKGNLINNPDNETIDSIAVEDTLMIPSGINISDIDTLKQYLTFSGIDENNIEISVETTDGSYIRTVKIIYTLDTANEINNFLYSQNNKIKFDIVGAIRDCGTSIAKGSTITITNDLQTTYTTEYHNGTADKVTVNTEITKDEGAKFEFDKTVNSVESQNGTYNNGEGYVIQGDKVTFYMTVENNGTDAGDITFYDNAPYGTEITAVSIISSNGASEVKWQQSESNTNKAEGSAHVEPGGRIVVAMTIRITQDTTRQIRNDLYSNGQSVAYATIDQKKRVDLSISKTVDKWTVDPGDTINYTVTVTNKGIDSITTDIIDYIPDGITITDSNGGTLTTETNDNGDLVPIVAWRDVTIGAGQTINYTLVATINSDAQGSISNLVVVDKGGENERWAEVTINVKDLENQTRLTKLVNNYAQITANNGDSIEYTIQLKNNGEEYNLDDIGGSIVVTDEIPGEIEWDLSNCYYVVNGIKYTTNIVRNGNTITWTVTSIGSNGKVFPQWGEITLHIPGTINVGDITEDKTIINTAVSETINKESTATIIVKAPRDVQLEKYVYKIYDENDNLIYTNTTGGKVSSIDIPVSENYTVVYRVNIKNVGALTIDKLALTEQAIYPNGVDQQLAINNYYYTNIDTSDTNIAQPTDADILFIKQYNSSGGYDGYFTTQMIYWWGNATITTEDYTRDTYEPYTKRYSDNLGDFSLEPNEELIWEYSFKTTNNNFRQVTNKITNTDDKKEYTSETLYAPKRIKSLSKKVALTDKATINTNNNYVDNLNLLYHDMDGKYLIYKVSMVTEGYVNDVLTITDSFTNNNLSYVTSSDDANLPIVKVTKSTTESREYAEDFTTYSSSVNGKNLTITLNQTEDSSNYYNLYYDIYYLVKLNDSATENIDSINTASITYKGETISDTAEVIILAEQIYPGVQKEYQGVYYSGTSKEDDTGHNPNLSHGASSGARIVWKITLSNSQATNSKDMVNYTLSDVLPTGYEYDDFYKNSEDTSTKYYPSIVIYDATGAEVKRYDAYENTFIEPTISTKAEDDTEKVLLEWNFNGEEYALKPGYKMEILISCKIDVATSGKFINNAYLTIEDGFKTSNVCYGDVTTFNSKQAIHDLDSITTYSAIVTTSYKEAETLYAADSELYDYANSATDNKTIKGIAGEDIQYKLNIKNDSLDTMKSLVLIDRLPYVGDRYILTSDNTRNSGFRVKYKEISDITIKRVDIITGDESEETLIEGTDYTVEFSNEKENIFNGESPDWQGGNQDASWHSEYSENDVNIRIIFRDDVYIDPADSIKIILKATIPTEDEIENFGEENVAWNNFGYCFTAVKYEDKSDVISENIVAESAPVGVWVEAQYTKLKFTKVWNDNNNLHQVRPSSIQIQLKKRAEGDTDYVSVGNPITLNRNLYESSTNTNEWGYVFEDLPSYENGKKLEYTVEELNYGENYTQTSSTTTETDDGFAVVINNTEETGKLIINKVVKYNEENITNSSTKKFYFVIKTNDNKYVLHNAEGNTYLKQIDSIPTYSKLNEVLWELNMQENHMLEVPNLILGKTYQVIEVTSEGNTITGSNFCYNVSYSTNSINITHDQSTANVTVTNSVKTVDVNLIKKWEDSNNLHSIRPNSITIQLYANVNGTETAIGDPVEITAQNQTDANTWSYTFTKLRKYDENGNLIVYTVKEVGTINNYLSSEPVTNGYTTTITNTELVGRITVVKKLINAGSDITSSADKMFYFVLKQGNDGYVTKTKEISSTINSNCIYSIRTGLNGNDGYSETIEDLELGKTYTVIEVDENGQELTSQNSIYTVTYTDQTIQLTNNNVSGTTTITNELEKTSIEVTKIWNDAVNTSYRPQEVIITLYAGANIAKDIYGNLMTYTLTNANKVDDYTWKTTFNNLPAYDENGTTIVYTISEQITDETAQKFYSTEINQETMTITNNLEENNEKIKLSIEKTWDNQGNEYEENFRPTNVMFMIVRTDTNKVVKNEIVNKETNWKYSCNDLPKYNSSLNLITYEVYEVIPENDDFKFYDVSDAKELTDIEGINGAKVRKAIITKDTEDEKEYEIVNQFNIPDDKITIRVNKIWDAEISKIPDSIDVTVIADVDGNKTQTKYTINKSESTVSEDGKNWSFTINNLPKYDSVTGKEISYSVEENEIADYKSSTVEQNYNGDNKSITFKNVLNIKKIIVNKIWNDDNNKYGLRPESITLILHKNINGVETIEQKVVNKADCLVNGNTWQYEIKDLPIYDDNDNLIIYSVDENASIFDWYYKSDMYESTKDGEQEFTITNTEILGNYSLELKKVDENGDLIPGIEFEVNGESYITDDNGKILIIDNKEIYDNTTESITIEEISYKGIDLEKKYIKLKDKLTLYISKQRIGNQCKVTGISFDNNKFATELSEYVKIENDEEVEVIAKIVDNNITLTIPNIEEIFDLSLKKFVSEIDGEKVEAHEPEFVKNSDGTYTYNMSEDPIEVENNRLVTYTIRVYNEGNVHGYASIVEDDLPEGLEFIPENSTNIEYGWKMIDKNGNITDNKDEAVKIQTDYLSEKNGTIAEDGYNSNLIKEFNTETMSGPDSKEVKVVLKVVEPTSTNRIVKNKAQIIEEKDYAGEEVKDIDSTPNEWIDGDDDQYIEKIRVKYFDLSLEKYITEVITNKDGTETVRKTGNTAEKPNTSDMTKIDLKKSEIDNSIIKIKYEITVTNDGEIAGYAKEISDYIPNGLEFNAKDNPEWTNKDGKVITTELANTLLQPGESAKVSILLTWINDSNNIGTISNTAEISEDYNEYDAKDKDSTPNNKLPGEDDIDTAVVMITVKTGSEIILYITVGLGVLAVVGLGIFGIKKYVK